MKKIILLSLLASFYLLSKSQVEIGNTTGDFTEIEEDGTIEFHGEATVRNDYVVPFSSVNTNYISILPI